MKSRRATQNAFTLIELLVVIVIGVILGTLVVSSSTLWRSKGLTAAGNLVMEDMAFARELAISSNQPAEIWFLRPTCQTFFGGLQVYTVDANGISTPYGGVHHLSANVGIDSGAFLSPLFNATTYKKQWTTQPQPTISGYGTSYDAWYVRFMPDGTTTATQQLFLTLHDISLGDQLTSLPQNYAVVSLDYVTGTVSLYLP
jgi:uncharacterized protein (TIGR02596 family)